MLSVVLQQYLVSYTPLRIVLFLRCAEAIGGGLVLVRAVLLSYSGILCGGIVYRISYIGRGHVLQNWTVYLAVASGCLHR